jgi:hypothetical protein
LEPLVEVRILLPELGRHIMKLLKGERLFFGCKIDSKLREALAQAKPGDRRYFEDPNGEFLRVLTFEDERWIGKVMGGGVQVSDVEDIQRNVVSILRRVAPNVRTSPSSIKIFAVAAEGDVVIADDHEPPVDDAEDKGEGPYIDYP